MRCMYCNENVVGHKNITILPGEGPVHIMCHETHLLTIGKRTIGGIDLKDYSIELLAELKELILMEMNSRSVEDVGAAELF